MRRGTMKYEVKDLNAPSRWNMRIWDNDNGEWLCQSDKDALTYYGFDITGGETTEFQGLPKWHPDRHLVWEQSTGLKDKNGKEIYEGDIVTLNGEWEEIEHSDCAIIAFEDGCFRVGDGYENEAGSYLSDWRIIGNIHENPELVKEE